VLTLLVLVLSKLVPGWGLWYSITDWYRPQINALMDGRLCLSNTLSDLQHDNAWSGGGVQQVWGLGVPFLRLPFEWLARACGYDAAPDRLVLGFWIFCTVFWGYHVLIHQKIEQAGTSSNAWQNMCQHVYLQKIIGLLLLIFFPALIVLLSSRMMVFEEALAYTYLYGIVEAITLLWFIRKLQLKRWLILCIMAGLGAFIRPTLFFYGVSSLVTSLLVLYEKRPYLTIETQKSWSQRCGFQSCSWLLGPILFILGGGLLFLTNLQRFDDGFEFGHKLNVQWGDSMFGSMYSTRFGYPYEDEPIASSSKELFGMLFLPAKYNNGNWYEQNLFPGQSKTFRWRETYLRTYDMSVLGLVLCGFIAGGLTLGLRKQRVQKLFFDNTLTYSYLAEVAYLTLWSFLAVVPLVYFYLWTPVITSRYMLDFAPAFAVAIFAFYRYGLQRIKKPELATLLGVIFLGWLLADTILSLHVVEHGPSWQTSVGLNTQVSSQHYQQPGKNETYFDGLGWDKESGASSPIVTVFLHNVDFLELEIEANQTLIQTMSQAGEPDFLKAPPEVIRAKIGVEYLVRESISFTKNGWKIRFKGPHKKVYQTGYQVVFLAMIAKEHLGYMNSTWLLKSVRWNQTDKPKSVTSYVASVESPELSKSSQTPPL